MSERLKRIENYNFWNGNVPELGFQRIAYTDKVFSYVGNRLVKVLIGQRRVGKSYLLRQIAHRLIQSGVLPQNILYINKEFTAFDFLSDSRSLEELFLLYKSELKPVGKVYLLLDEIQNIDGWEHFVNSYSQDFTSEYEIFVTGSNSEMLSGELASLLSGRYVEFLVLPFGFTEYAELKKQTISKETYLKYLNEGGLPELFYLPGGDIQFNYISAVKDTILLRDIVQRYNIKDAKLLEDIFTYLVNNTSQLLSISNIVSYFASKNRKTNYETVSSYIGYIENAFLIHKAERYQIQGKETISGTAKYYMNDLSYQNLYPGFSSGAGYMLENAVYLELLRNGYKVYVGNLKNKDKEVDFVALRGNRVIYLQCAYLLSDEKTIEREYSALMEIKDNYEKVVVTLDDYSFPQREGIIHAQAWKLHEIL
ncbi:ATP-binding protein [Methanolapillus millepedarum]|uniref:ATP-binding protein n=1 Tax=Methanolapillus millepedarum TaxID=3028296 RepID=A0AA96VD40_9EURY|nr:hypothetical protein MsAc7_00490 [Methanosarcinaceae archaeon Ac7]